METRDILPFELDGQRFGLLAENVLRILHAATPTRLPKAPAAVLGVLNVHGTLVPVFDIRSRFGLRPRPLQPADHVVLVRAGARTAAIVVDKAEALLSVPASSIHRALLSTALEHVAGIAALPDGSLILYDLDTFLTAAEASELGDALAVGVSARVEP